MENTNYILYETIQKILNLTNTGLIVIDEEGTIVLINDYFAQTVCKTHTKTFYNANILSINEMPQEVKRLILLDNSELLQNTKVAQYNGNIMVLRDSQLNFRIVKAGFEEKNKKYVLTLFVDITKEAIIYKLLKKGERKYRYLLDSVPLGLLTVDANTLEIRRCNEQKRCYNWNKQTKNYHVPSGNTEKLL